MNILSNQSHFQFVGVKTNVPTQTDTEIFSDITADKRQGKFMTLNVLKGLF